MKRYGRGLISFQKKCNRFAIKFHETKAMWGWGRVRKSKNFPDSKISTAKTFRIKCVNRDIDDFATNARKT